MRLHPRLTRWPAHLPRRTVRLRLTALYGVLFLASGTGLLAITITIVFARGWPPPTSGESFGLGSHQTRGMSQAHIHKLMALPSNPRRNHPSQGWGARRSLTPTTTPPSTGCTRGCRTPRQQAALRRQRLT
jgi:hypothetical protein